MSSRYSDDDEFNTYQRSFSGPVLVAIGVVSGIILIILLLVLATNSTSGGKNNLKNAQMLNSVETPAPETAEDVARNYTDAYGNKDIEALYRDGKLRADDLDFWNMYGDGSKVIKNDSNNQNAESRSENSENNDDDGNTPNETEASAQPTPSESPSFEPSPSQSPEGDNLIEGIKLNSVDYTNLKTVNQKMHYYMNGNEISKLGVEISENSGVVDFQTLKANEVDFVMIKVGSRGYDSGVISLDSNFLQNIKAADEAGIKVGLYFSSRAVTEQEAVDEANFCIDQSNGYKVSYPVAFEFEGKLFDETRTDFLDEEGLTKIAYTFMKQIEGRGYEAVLGGNEDYLLKETKPEKLLKDFSVYLDNQDSMPSFPYQFKMWKYLTNVAIPGVEKPASYVISFIDYAGR